MPGSFLGAGNPAVNKIDIIPALGGPTFRSERVTDNYIDISQLYSIVVIHMVPVSYLSLSSCSLLLAETKVKRKSLGFCMSQPP